MRIRLSLALFILPLFVSGKSLDPMCSSKSNKSALVVIDMQDYFIKANGVDISKRPQNVKKVEALFKAQKEAIEKAKAAKIPIIFVEYESPDKNWSFGKTNEDLFSASSGHKDVVMMKKSTDGLFDTKNKHQEQLRRILRMYDIGKILVVGANGGACVQESIEGALENSCDVVAYSSGIVDFNYVDYVYPYAGRYTELKKDPSFKEVSKIESFETQMTGPQIQEAPKKTSKQKTKNQSGSKKQKGKR